MTAEASITSLEIVKASRARTKCDESRKSQWIPAFCGEHAPKAHLQELTRASYWPLGSGLVSWDTPIRRIIFHLFHVCFSPLLA